MTKAAITLLHVLALRTDAWMKGSHFFRLIEGLMSGLGRFIGGSALARLLASEADEAFLRKSLIFRLTNGFFLSLKQFGRKFIKKLYDDSYTVAYIRGLGKYCLSTSVSSLGLGLGAGLLAYMFASGSFNLILAIPGIIALVFVFSPQSIISFLHGSAVARLFMDSLQLSLPPGHPYAPRHRLLPAVFGITLGISAAFWYSGGIAIAFVLFAIPAGILLFSFPFTGVLGVAAMLPFLPTMVTGLLIGMVTISYLLKLMVEPKRYAFRLDLVGLWLVVTIGINILVALNSFTPVASIQIAALTSIYMWFALLCISMLDTRARLHSFLCVFSISAAVAALYGFWQSFSGVVDTTHLDMTFFEGMRLRVFSSFDNPNVYGSYLLLAIPIALTALFLTHILWLRIMYLGITAMLVANLAMTYSRGCYVAIGVSTLVFVLLMERRLIVLAAGALPLVPLLLPETVLVRLVSILNMADSSTVYRLAIWQASLRSIREFWFAGVGQGTGAFNAVYQLNAFHTVTAQHSHNLFLQIFIESGIIGLVVFFSLLGSYFKLLWPHYRSSSTLGQRAVAAMLLAMMAGFLTQGMFDYSFYNHKVFLAFTCTLAVASAFAATHANKAKIIDFA